MRCQDCGQEEASVLFTQVTDHEKEVYHLCKACADRRSGSVSSLTISVSTSTSGGAAAQQARGSLSCPACHTTFAQFQEHGRFGCASCYTAFAQELDAIFKRIHGASAHLADMPDGGTPRQARLEFLEMQLAELVQQEAFEEAARVRDLIARVKSGVGAA